MKTILLCAVLTVCTVSCLAKLNRHGHVQGYRRPVHHNGYKMRNPHIQQNDYNYDNYYNYYDDNYEEDTPTPSPTIPSGVGTIYTRWGRTSCPDTDGTSLVYDGYAAGTHYARTGGGANYLCITKAPKYRNVTASDTSRISRLNGAEYEDPVVDTSLDDQNVPCAVCHTSMRSVRLMIPGQFECPDDTWTEEYNGYLMSGKHTNAHTFMFECVDKNIEVIENSSSNRDGALFYHVGVKCNYGLPCESDTDFKEMKPLTCVVCTK